MTQFLAEPDRLRSKLRRRFDRLRGRSRDSCESTVKIRPRTSQDTQADPSLKICPSDKSPCETCSSDQLPLSLTSDATEGRNARNNDVQVQLRQKPFHRESSERHMATNQTTIGMTNFAINTSDIWSAAYREAVESLRDGIDIAILEGRNIAQLFTELDQLEREVAQESAFDRGLRCLRSLQVPLERFKLLLDLATPLAAIEPTATAVVGVLRGVTAIAISFATADLDFAKQIAEMLEKISYIDDCDTLGQRTDRKDIHKALVMVYQKIIEFYKVAYEMLSRKGAKLIIKMVLETDRLPSIVQDFLRHSDTLRNLIQKATWEIVEDIKTMLYDHESKCSNI
ncbi:hypothetical protein BDV33DRAFT_210698 [Aspergillus novoparasiticus]|uniref:Fungal STAND N-terminal Goodbye domain-containing protein n=1 Tax=Aspergillus novoparasiticus TaxID=986946 RepID=A0A5N6E5U2_9EURO|nr:hypothetical protein BDV33DRAFT_210698 [Aspergillus novoparasiticus]